MDLKPLCCIYIIRFSFDERSLQLANLRRSDADDVIRSLSAAFDVWSYGTCLKFYRMEDNQEADMKISFKRCLFSRLVVNIKKLSRFFLVLQRRFPFFPT